MFECLDRPCQSGANQWSTPSPTEPIIDHNYNHSLKPAATRTHKRLDRVSDTLSFCTICTVCSTWKVDPTKLLHDSDLDSAQVQMIVAQSSGYMTLKHGQGIPATISSFYTLSAQIASYIDLRCHCIQAAPAKLHRLSIQSRSRFFPTNDCVDGNLAENVYIHVCQSDGGCEGSTNVRTLDKGQNDLECDSRHSRSDL